VQRCSGSRARDNNVPLAGTPSPIQASRAPLEDECYSCVIADTELRVATNLGAEVVAAILRRYLVVPHRGPNHGQADLSLHLVGTSCRVGQGTAGFALEVDGHFEENLGRLLTGTLASKLRGKGHLVLHGSVVAKAGRAAILTGPSGAGKTTLAMALLERDWSLLADDLAVLELPSLRCLPVPTALGLIPTEKPKGRAPDRGEPRPGKKQYCPPEQLFPTWHWGEPTPLTEVVFLAPATTGLPAVFRELGAAEAWDHLLETSYFTSKKGFLEGLGALLPGLARLKGTARCRLLKGGSVLERRELVDQLFHREEVP